MLEYLGVSLAEEQGLYLEALFLLKKWPPGVELALLAVAQMSLAKVHLAVEHSIKIKILLSQYTKIIGFLQDKAHDCLS